MWGYTCPLCEAYWESYQSDPGREWCPCCEASVEPEQWEIPEEMWEKGWVK